jgi:hypothetical protein
MGGGVKSRRVGRVCGADVTVRLSRAVTHISCIKLVSFNNCQDIQIQDIKPLKTSINLNHISSFGSYLAVNILRLRYKNESRNAVKGNNRKFDVHRAVHRNIFL